ncbi:AGROH133_08824 family phage infection protein [Oryzifoliimicrobium ureilyticus]|uniref:AGROH133_08824 family phage infection protein n=1 Tax=Oryzifoliimicrobium ureilyticus TaxID=3113724 RepID=UPI0030761CA0
MELYFPTEFGERLAFLAAAVTALLGLFMMFAPGYAQKIQGLMPREGRRDGFAETRSTGGFYLGFGLAAICLAQDWIYMALGASFAMAVFARLISLLSDKGNTIANYLLLIAQIVLAALPLGYAGGFFAN